MSRLPPEVFPYGAPGEEEEEEDGNLPSDLDDPLEDKEYQESLKKEREAKEKAEKEKNKKQ